MTAISRHPSAAPTDRRWGSSHVRTQGHRHLVAQRTDFGYKTYSRDHLWKFENGIEVPASAAPDYLGNPQCVDPETAFVAALSSCHMLTFLAVASHKGFVVDTYEDHAVGHLEKNARESLP